MSRPVEAGSEADRRTIITPIDGALLAVVLIWGLTYVPFRLGQQELPTGLFNLVRYVVAVPVFWVVLLPSREDWRMPRKDLPRTVAIGLVGVLLYSMLFAGAAKITNAANVALLLALSPIWGVLMGWAMGRRGRPTLPFALGSLVAFGGAATVIIAGAGTLRFGLDSLGGDLMALAASVIWAWYGIMAQPLLRTHSGLKVQAWINGVGLAGFILYQGPAALRFDWASVTWVGWSSAIAVSLGATVITHLIWYTAIAKVGPDRVLLAMYLVPAVAAVTGAFFLGQPFGVVQMLGAVLALAGVAMVRRSSA